MKWMLDTNACIRYINGRAPQLQRRLDSTKAGEVVVCSIVKAELFFGSARSTDPARSIAIQRRFLSGMTSLVFDDSCSEIYATIRSSLAAAGTPIGTNDMLIAAIAIANDVTLISHNTEEFSRVPGLKIEDWELP
jgi:tRNA(fMet)-specific endonuclease VapC